MLSKRDKIIAVLWGAFVVWCFVAVFTGHSPFGNLPYNPEWEIR